MSSKFSDDRSQSAWAKALAERDERREYAMEMGGPDKVAKQLARGKLTARDRLDALLDADSFEEIGQLAGKGQYTADGALEHVSPSNLIFGRGKINDRPVVATSDDFTVRGGASDAAIYRKFILAEQMAHTLKLPLIRMVDGTGGGGSVKSLEDIGYTYVPMVPGWEHVVKNLDTVPVVGLSLGPTAGLGAARIVASHYSVMVKGVSQIFTAGPAVVAALGEHHSKEELGGSEIHTRNGVIDDEVATEQDAFEKTRIFLSYLPRYVGDVLPIHVCHDPADRRDDGLLSIIPKNSREAYNMRRILDSVADRDTVFEMGTRWGRAVITAFARFNGCPVAVLASDPTYLGGSWTADSAEKAKRFIELAERFRLPLVHLVDNPGFMIGLEAERSATIRRGVEAMNGVYKATIPWATVIIRKAFGVAGAAMSDASKFQFRAAWPSGDWGSLPMEGGIEVAYQAEISAADDPEAELAAIKARLKALTSPFRTAEAFMIEDIIDPRQTRQFLCDFIALVVKDGHIIA